MLHQLLCSLSLSLALLSTAAHGVTLVDEGAPRAVLVIADDPAEVAAYAARELQLHVRKATGVTLPIMPESRATNESLSRIYIGDTRAAAERRIVPADLGADGFVLRIIDNDLYVLGSEDGDNPFERRAGSKRGTMFGVYELLERHVHVRWLWPGDLGTQVPRTDTLAIEGPLDESVEPAFRFRRVRAHVIRQAAADYDPKVRRLAFSDEGLRNYAEDLKVFKARYRVGDSEAKPVVGHHFAGWWERYGDQHPEWFMLRENGVRGPRPDETSAFRLHHVPMCVSNPELHRFIVEEQWDGGDELRLGEVDRREFCRCENCLAWDEPVPVTHPSFVKNLYQPMVSNRYARFWKTIREMAAERNPDVVVTTFLYWNYIPAPTSGVQFDGTVYGEFVPWGQDEVTYFPMAPAAYKWLERQWQGWARSGVVMAYRPNYFHGGYVMPHLSTRQAGDFFKFAADNGMIGFDHDMLIGHWAVKGPMFYIQMKLGVDPALNVEELRREYFDAFGPASSEVEAYFDYWERYALRRPGGNLHNHVDAHIAYPQEVFRPAAAHLDRAAQLVAEDASPEYAQRVAFLRAGMEHARLASKFSATLDLGRVPREPDRFRAAQAALKELVAFRREHEHLYIADYIWASRQENRRIDIDALLADVDEADLLPAEAVDLHREWVFRKDPDDRGVQERWYSPQPAEPGAWKAIAVPAFWAHTHVGDYLGYGWYRNTFTIPEKQRGEPLNILFESVDEQAWVYVNGRLVGEHTVESEGLPTTELWNRPFTIQVPTESLDAEGENTLVVRVHSSMNNAGIWGPVRIYAPRDLN